MPSWTLTLHLPLVLTSVISGRPLQREGWVWVLNTVLARGLVALRCPVDVKRERSVSDLRLHLTTFNIMNTTSELHSSAITAVFFSPCRVKCMSMTSRYYNTPNSFAVKDGAASARCS
jgi:hypothetical protein